MTGGKRQRQRIEQRNRILGAAHELFATHGFDDVTMAEVAEKAGVARATVFNHFRSKHALVEALTEEVIVFYRVMLDNALADESTPTPVLVRALFEHVGAGVEWDFNFFRGVFREIAKLRLGLDEDGPGQRANEAAHARLVELVRRGQARGELSTAHSAEVVAAAMTSLMNGTITHWLYEDPSGPLAPRMRAAAEVLLQPVALAGSDPGAALPKLTPDRPFPAGALSWLEEQP
jgi:AcrR family transcriptional regulator